MVRSNMGRITCSSLHPARPFVLARPTAVAKQRRRSSFSVALILLLWTGLAFAQEAPAESLTNVERRPTASRRVIGIQLDEHPGWSLGLEGYTGLTTLSTSEGTKGHAIGGGVSRLRFGHFEGGVALETSDYSGERWRSFGGFLGAFFPFTNWVDVDVSAGLALRNYVSGDSRYGTSGATARVPSFTLRFGISERPIGGLLGLRIGAAMLTGIDLKQRDVAWSYEIRDAPRVRGVSHFGGTTIGIVVTLGFDLAKRSDARR